MTDAAVGPRTGAPWHLWVVGVLALLWDGFGAFDFTATLTRFDPYMSQFPQEMLDYYYAMPAWMIVIWGVAVWSGVLGVILLLLRRKLSVALLGLAVVTAAVSFAVTYLQPAPEIPGSTLFTIAIIGISVLILGYAWWMSRRGVLH